MYVTQKRCCLSSLSDATTTGFPAGERTQKFHSDDVSLARSGKCFWLVEENFTRGTTNQKHYPDLGSHTSSVRNFHTRFSNVMSRGNRAMSAVFYGYKIPWKKCFEKVALHSPSQEGWARRKGLVWLMSVKRLISFSALLKSPGHNTKRQLQHSWKWHYLESPRLVACLNDLCGGNKVILESYDVLFCFVSRASFIFLFYFKVKGYATCHLGNSPNAIGYLPTRPRTQTAWEYSPVETQVQDNYSGSWHD